MKKKYIIHDTNVSNGKLLKEYRKKNEITGQQFAKELNISDATYYRWEKGYRPIEKGRYSYLVEDLGLDLQPPVYSVKQEPVTVKLGSLRGPYNRNKTKSEKIQHVLKTRDFYKPTGTSGIKRRRLYVDVIANITYLSKFGERLKDIRYSKNLTLQEMADKLDLTSAHLWKLEQGEAITLRISTLKLLIDMGVSIDDLFKDL